MFFPDRNVALDEMKRVLAPGGGLGLAFWASIDQSPAYADQANIVARLAGEEAAAVVRSPFALANPLEIKSLLESSGFDSISLETIPDTITYPSVDAFLEGEIDATPLGQVLLDQGQTVYKQIKSEVTSSLAPYIIDSRVSFPTAAHVVGARKPAV
jgi:hypothetical protein